MKTKLFILIPSVFISFLAFSQDSSVNSSKNKVMFTNKARVHSTITPAQKSSTKTDGHIYRDTRLGSSSPLYDTYKKNDYGAGAVTTNPHKAAVSAPPVSTFSADSARSASDSIK